MGCTGSKDRDKNRASTERSPRSGRSPRSTKSRNERIQNIDRHLDELQNAANNNRADEISDIDMEDLEDDFVTAADISDAEDDYDIDDLDRVESSDSMPGGGDDWDNQLDEDPTLILKSGFFGPEGCPEATTFGGAVKNCKRGIRGESIHQMPQNSWCQGWGEDYKTRIGPDYKKKGKKAPSGPSLYTCFGVDFFRSDKPIENIGAKVKVPKLPFEVPRGVVPGIFIMNIQLPTHKEGKPWTPIPFVGGKPKDGDGECINAVLYYALKRSVAEQLKDLSTCSPSLRLLEHYFTVAPTVVENGKNGYGDDRGRFKMIARVHENIPKIIARFNGKPALVTHDGRLFVNEHNTVMDVNVNSWAYAARAALYSLGGTHPTGGTGMLGKVKCWMGMVIESREDEHMPEQMMGCVQIAELLLRDNMTEWKPEWGKLEA